MALRFYVFFIFLKFLVKTSASSLYSTQNHFELHYALFATMTFLRLFSLTQSSVYKEKVTYGSDVTILKIAIFSHRRDLKNTDKITELPTSETKNTKP